MLNKSSMGKTIDLLSAKKIVMFDLDGTLTESKAKIDKETAMLFCRLLGKKVTAVIGGGDYLQFEKQFIRALKCSKKELENLLILPTSGGRMYKYGAGKWQLVYKNSLTAREKSRILEAFSQAFRDISYLPPKSTYGPVLEDRESQITFSALGQKASVAKKRAWNKERDIRPQLKAALEKHLPGFEVRLGGFTSIDVTKKGIDKAYGIRQVKKLLSVPIRKMVYIGDALYEGGNDFVVLQTGIDAVQVSGFKETRCLIRKLILECSRVEF